MRGPRLVGGTAAIAAGLLVASLTPVAVAVAQSDLPPEVRGVVDPPRVASPEDGAETFPGENGRIAFVRGVNTTLELHSVNANGSDHVRLTNNSAADDQPAWSPDGGRLAFASTRDGNLEIYLMNADGTGVTRLTNNAATDAAPAWSPDGTKIAFTSTRAGGLNYEIYVMNVDGSGVTRLTTNSPAVDDAPAWSPDGTHIAYSSEGHLCPQEQQRGPLLGLELLRAAR